MNNDLTKELKALSLEWRREGHQLRYAQPQTTANVVCGLMLQACALRLDAALLARDALKEPE
jgi:hypothetical protein